MGFNRRKKKRRVRGVRPEEISSVSVGAAMACSFFDSSSRVCEGVGYERCYGFAVDTTRRKRRRASWWSENTPSMEEKEMFLGSNRSRRRRTAEVSLQAFVCSMFNR